MHHRSFAAALALLLGGCSSVRDVVRTFVPARDTVQPVVPGFALSGRAAHLQDSLHAQLEWLSKEQLPSGLALSRLSFRNRPDSTQELVATLRDSRRINSHGLDRPGVRAQETDRIRRESPLLVSARSAGIRDPLVVRSIFQHKNYLFQGAKPLTDTVEVPLLDSGKSSNPD